jgi:hypothetical protein
MNNVILVPSSFHIHNNVIQSPTVTADISTKTTAEIFVNGVPATGRINSKGHPERWTVTTHQMNEHNTGFVYDPMHEHLEWYGIISSTNEMSFDSYMIKRCFWSFKEFTTELEKRSTDVTLVQKIANGAWRVRFKSDDDYSYWRTRTFSSKSHQFHIGNINLDTDTADVMALHNEMRSWCKTNLVGQYELDSRGRSINAFVKEDNDAVLFKLRWIDVDI